MHTVSPIIYLFGLETCIGTSYAEVISRRFYLLIVDSVLHKQS